MEQDLTPNFISEDIFSFIPAQLNIEGWGVRSNSVMTRAMVKNYPTMVSCRTWQLVYFVMFYYNKYTNYTFIEHIKSYLASYKDIRLLKSGSNIGIDLKNISNILNYILDKRNANPLYSIVIDAKVNKHADILQKITTLDDVNPYILQQNNLCCCLYSESPDEMYRDVYILDHFFNIIYIDNVYYLNSAYGSSFVRVPQYSTILTAEEFNYFCSALGHLKDGDANQHQSQRAINDFFIKYFLTGNLSLPRPSDDDDDDDDDDEDTQKRKRDMMSPEEGIRLEIAQYINAGKRNNFGVGIIPVYNTLVTSSIQTFLTQFGGRKVLHRRKVSQRKRKVSQRKRKVSQRKRKVSHRKKSITS
jgi:hypothetical protein